MDEKAKIQKIFKKQQNIGIMSFFAELPNFISMIISALLANSLVVWMDVVDSFNNLARSSVVVISSKHIMKTVVQNDKFERRISLVCDFIVLASIICILFCAVNEFYHPVAPSSFLLVTIAIKFINVSVDAFMVYKQNKIRKNTDSLIVKAEYNGFIKDLVFDVVALIIIALCFFLRNYFWSRYISPVICVIMSIFFIKKYTMDIYKKVKKQA